MNILQQISENLKIRRKDGKLNSRYINTAVFKQTDLYRSIISSTNFLPLSTSMTVRFFYVINRLTEEKKCSCGKVLVKDLRATYCSSKCSNSSIVKQDTTRAVCLAKYGKTSYSKTQEFKKKAKDTNLEKYGVDNYAKTDESKQKTLQTNKDRYGAEHKNQAQINPATKEILLSEEKFTEFCTHKSKAQITSELNVDFGTVTKYIQKYNCEELIVKIQSYPEHVVAKYIQENYNTEIIRNTRKIIAKRD